MRPLKKYKMLVTLLDENGGRVDTRYVERAETEHLARRKVMERHLADGKQVVAIHCGLEENLV